MKLHTSALLLAAVGTLPAATLSVTRSAELAENSTFNIDDYGALDWAIWKNSGGTGAALATPTHFKAGANLISDLSVVGGGGFQGSINSVSNWDFIFTGSGGSPVSGTSTNVNGVFNDQLQTQGAGLGLNITLPTTDTYKISLFAAAYGVDGPGGLLTADLDGLVDTSGGVQGDFIAPKDMYLFTIIAQADTAGQVLNIEFINNDPTSGGNAHVLINAAAIQIVPEPGSLSLLGLAALPLLRRRR
ncbi:MAG: hypothetical protein ACQKBY_01750 [Verrucomicrobiales bacterium]